MKINNLIEFFASKEAEELSVSAIDRICRLIERDRMKVWFSEALTPVDVDGWKEITPSYGVATTSEQKSLRQLKERAVLTFRDVLSILHTDPQVKSGAIFHTIQGPVEAVRMDDGKKWFVGARSGDEPVPQGTQIIFFQSQEEKEE